MIPALQKDDVLLSDIAAAERSGGLGDRTLDLRFVGRVGDDRDDRGAGLVEEFGGSGREAHRVACEDRDRSALEREPARNRPADAARAAGDERALAVKFEIHGDA